MRIKLPCTQNRPDTAPLFSAQIEVTRQTIVHADDRSGEDISGGDGQAFDMKAMQMIKDGELP